MVNLSRESAASLLDLLNARARASSDSRLAANAIGGMALVLTFSIWRIPAWYALVAIGACFLAYGIWAIANRELVEARTASRAGKAALRTLAFIAATCGVGAGIFLLMVVLARTLGRIIS